MIPTQTLESFPVFGSNATRVEPGDAKKAAGWQQADVVPAEWMNWEWYKASKGITELNAGVSSIEKEINAVLTDMGITPAEATEDQLRQALAKMMPQMGTCSTASATAAKTVAITGDVLKAGKIYVIEMEHGNSAINPTLSINGGTAYPLCNASGVRLSGAPWLAGDTITVMFTGSKFLMETPVKNLLNNTNNAAVAVKAVGYVPCGTNKTITDGPSIGTGGVVRFFFNEDITASNTSTPLTISYNGISIGVKATKGSNKVDVYARNISGTYKYIQRYTTLEMVYDGTDFIIVGNPVLLSDTDYIVYADGRLGVDLAHPVNSIYVQYNGQSDPNTLFKFTTWTDVSSTYNGQFFRANGGDSAEFGTPQQEGLPNITGELRVMAGNQAGYYTPLGIASASGALYTDTWADVAQMNGYSTPKQNNSMIKIDASKSSQLYGNSQHVTPYNSSIKIWKRTA